MHKDVPINYNKVRDKFSGLSLVSTFDRLFMFYNYLVCFLRYWSNIVNFFTWLVYGTHMTFAMRKLNSFVHHLALMVYAWWLIWVISIQYQRVTNIRRTDIHRYDTLPNLTDSIRTRTRTRTARNCLSVAVVRERYCVRREQLTVGTWKGEFYLWPFVKGARWL